MRLCASGDACFMRISTSFCASAQKALGEASDVLRTQPHVFREPMAIRPNSLVASVLPDDQHGWERAWSKQPLSLLLFHEKRLLDFCVRIKL